MGEKRRSTRRRHRHAGGGGDEAKSAAACSRSATTQLAVSLQSAARARAVQRLERVGSPPLLAVFAVYLSRHSAVSNQR